MGERNACLCLLLLFPHQKQLHFAQGDPGRRRGDPGAGGEPTYGARQCPARRGQQPGQSPAWVFRAHACKQPVLLHQTKSPTAQPGSPAQQSREVKGFMPVKHRYVTSGCKRQR